MRFCFLSQSCLPKCSNAQLLVKYEKQLPDAALTPGPEVIKLFSCSTQLSIKFIMLINVKMPTIVGILTFISMINTISDD